MEEQQIQEPIYLAYGNDAQIDQNAFLTAAANNVQAYVAKQPWSNKRKQMFMDAYAKIMQQGVTGASNVSGIWNIQHNGDPILLDNMSRKEREMTQEAAYFIQQQMQRLSAAKQKEEEDKKKEFTKFDNTAFTSGLQTHIGNSYGGQAYNDWIKEWNNLDAKDKYGMRATTNRAAALAQQLKSYRDSFKAEDYDFEGSPFSSADDFKSRLTDAIVALESPNPDDDREALNKLGLRFDDYLKTGLDSEATTTDGRTFATGREYVEWAQEQERLQAEADAKATAEKQKAAQQKAYDNTLFIRRMTGNVPGKTAAELKALYNGDDQKLIQALNNYSLNRFENLSRDQQSEINGAMRYMAKQPIDDKLYKQIKSIGRYANYAPGDFKRIKGVDGFIWDNKLGKVIQVQTRQQMQNTPGKDLFEGVQTPQEAYQKSLVTPRGQGQELTTADIIDIGATLADLGAMIDPEIISGTVLAMGAATARTWNRDWTNGNFWDNLWKSAIDLGTGALGGTPLLGDASSLYKFARGFGKIMTIPALWNMFTNAPEAKQAISKLDFSSVDNLTKTLKTLTPADYHAISAVLTGAIAGKGHVKGNLAERKVLQESGFSTQAKTKRREYANKFGITRTKVQDSTEVPTLKVKVNDQDVEVKLTKDDQVKLQEKVKKAGNSGEARDKAVKDFLKGKEHTTTQGTKVKVEDGTTVSVSSPSSIRDRSWVPGYLGTSSRLFGTTTEASARGVDNFQNWLNQRSTWDQYKPWSYGTNSNLQRIYNAKGLGSTTQQQQTNDQQSQSTRQQLSIEARAERFTNPTRRAVASYNNTIKEALNPTKSRTTGMNLTNTGGASSSIIINGKTIKFDVAKNSSGDFELIINNGGTISTHALTKGNNTQAEFDARKIIAKTVDDAKKAARGTFDKKAMNEFFKQIKNLKKQGFLKQGGTIDKQKISEYLNYINK